MTNELVAEYPPQIVPGTTVNDVQDVNYEHEIQPWFKAMLQKMFEALDKNLGWHLCIYVKPI